MRSISFDSEKFKTDTFWRNNSIAFIGTISVAALNYLYHPILGRLMLLSDFGEVEVIISLILQMGIFFSTFSLIVVNVVANADDEIKKNYLVGELERFALLLIFIFSIIILIFSRSIGTFLQFESHLSLLAFPVILALSVPIIFRTAYLQGHKDFVGVTFIGVLGAIFKLVLSVILILLGLRTFGAVSALILAQVLALMYSLKRASSHGYHKISYLLKIKRLDTTAIKKQLRYAGFILVVIFIMTVLYSGDVIVVKRYFSPEEAGLYSGIATIARIIFFATSSVLGVLLPSVKVANPAKENHKILLRSLLLVVAIGGSALALFTLFPSFFVKLLLGERFVEKAYLLPSLSLAIFLISIANLYSYYLIALKRYFVAFATTIGAIATFSILYFNHSNLPSIITGMTYGSVLILLLLISDAAYRFIKKRSI